MPSHSTGHGFLTAAAGPETLAERAYDRGAFLSDLLAERCDLAAHGDDFDTESPTPTELDRYRDVLSRGALQRGGAINWTVCRQHGVVR